MSNMPSPKLFDPAIYSAESLLDIEDELLDQFPRQTPGAPHVRFSYGLECQTWYQIGSLGQDDKGCGIVPVDHPLLAPIIQPASKAP